jgi:DNA-binding NarL/FixJ family response regulator
VCVGHASGAADAIRGILAQQPDAVVLDIRLAEGNGFEVLRAVHERAPGIAFYMLSNFSDEPYRRLARQLGAEHFFDKSTELDSMREALALRAAKPLH